MLKRRRAAQGRNECVETTLAELAARPTDDNGIRCAKIAAKLIVLSPRREVAADPIKRRIGITLQRTVGCR